MKFSLIISLLVLGTLTSALADPASSPVDGKVVVSCNTGPGASQFEIFQGSNGSYIQQTIEHHWDGTVVTDFRLPLTKIGAGEYQGEDRTDSVGVWPFKHYPSFYLKLSDDGERVYANINYGIIKVVDGKRRLVMTEQRGVDCTVFTGFLEN